MKRLQGAQRGHVVSEKTRLKISAAIKGKIPWQKGKPSKYRGVPRSEETKRRISLANIGKKRSTECREKLSLFWKGKPKLDRRGEKNHFWKGGITKTNLVIRASLEYRLWREAIFERDSYTCIWCGARGGNGKKVVLNADHIKPFAIYPELRFAIDNGRTLCKDCHKTTGSYGKNNLGNIVS